MALIPKIPYSLSFQSAFQPKIFGVLNDKIIYHLFSPLSGRDLAEDVDHFPTFVEIIIPFGICCELKSIHFEENGVYSIDERMEKGLYRLRDGESYKITFSIPKGMNKNVIKRGDVLGALLFNGNVELFRYQPAVTIQNILRFQRLNPLGSIPIQFIGSAGIDLPANGNYTLHPQQTIPIATGIKFSIPNGYYGQILGRSGLAKHFQVDILAGTIDPNYRGEIFVIMVNHGKSIFKISTGDRIAQMVIQPYLNCIMVECNLDNTNRGANGFGSTGIKSENLPLPGNISFDFLENSNIISNQTHLENIEYKKELEDSYKIIE